jgi:hypothetical protein
MKTVLRWLMFLFLSPTEWRDMQGFVETKAIKRERLAKIQKGYLADIIDHNPMP